MKIAGTWEADPSKLLWVQGPFGLFKKKKTQPQQKIVQIPYTFVHEAYITWMIFFL